MVDYGSTGFRAAWRIPADVCPNGERIVRLVAHHVGAEVHAGSQRVSAESPETGKRFEGLLPPVVAAPAFAIRKPAVAVFALDDYVAAGIMNSDQAHALRAAALRKTIFDIYAAMPSSWNTPRMACRSA